MRKNTRFGDDVVEAGVLLVLLLLIAWLAVAAMVILMCMAASRADARSDEAVSARLASPTSRADDVEMPRVKRASKSGTREPRGRHARRPRHVAGH